MLFLLLIVIYIHFFLFFPSILEDFGSSLPHDSLVFPTIWFFSFINVILFIYYVRYSIIPFRMKSQSSSHAKFLSKGGFCVFLFCFVFLLLIFSLFFILLLCSLISLAECQKLLIKPLISYLFSLISLDCHLPPPPPEFWKVSTHLFSNLSIAYLIYATKLWMS